ncbi:MAG: RNA polymerase sigma factor [Saprospiraceae bacterium]|nr:RNA polymerase sigma factor [Saprospiraceae bacterium]
MSDSQLIKFYLDTQHSYYFDILYKRYAGKVFAKCISLLKEEEWAEDATQDIFLKIFLNLCNFSEKSKFSTWIYSITYNYCIDLLRRKKKDRTIFSEPNENFQDVAEEDNDHRIFEIEVDRLVVVLDNIAIADKAVLLMKYQDDMSIKEIAESMDKTESAIKMKIKRAKEKAVLVYEDLYKD